MADRKQPTHQSNEFERQLSDMAPRPSSLDRAALLFQAGKESANADRRRGRRRERGWQAAAAVMALVALAVSWHDWQEQTQVVERIRYEPAHGAVQDATDGLPLAKQTPRRDGNHYLQQRYVALTVGLDGLDEHDGPESFGRRDEFDDRRYRDLMDEFLEFQ